MKKLANQKDVDKGLQNILLELTDYAYFIENLHEELFEKIKPAANVYTKEEGYGKLDDDNVADVFVKMKARFLIYAPFIVHCNNVERLIGLMKIDASVSKDIETLEVWLRSESKMSSNPNIPASFNSLLAFPFQHVVR